MIYFFDTHYRNKKAYTAVIGINSWESIEPSVELISVFEDVEEYISGQFYKRELPCLLKALEELKLDQDKDILVVDGYVLLSAQGKLGLGGYLYESLNGIIPVIGVAKNGYAQNIKNMVKVFRGESKKPLYVTSLGIDIDYVGEQIKAMHGEFRLPTILKMVDLKSRENVI